MPSVRSWLSAVVVALFAAAAWLTIGPHSIGGPVTLTSVDGTSMQPHFFTGDLAVFYRHSSYRLGEVAAARVDGGIVVHRLVGGSANTGWRTKGDNRASEDTWTIPNHDILGSEAALWPGGGVWLVRATSPSGKALGVGLVAALLMLVPDRRPRRRPHRMQADYEEYIVKQSMPGRWRPNTPRYWEQPVLGSVIVVAMFSAVLGGLAFVTSATSFGSMSIATLRYSACAIAAVAAIAAAILGSRRAFAWRGSELDKIVARVGSARLLVTGIPPALETVPVGTVRELKDISARALAPILHAPGTGCHRFAVLNQGCCYMLMVPIRNHATQAAQAPMMSDIAKQGSPRASGSGSAPSDVRPATLLTRAESRP